MHILAGLVIAIVLMCPQAIFLVPIGLVVIKVMSEKEVGK